MIPLLRSHPVPVLSRRMLDPCSVHLTRRLQSVLVDQLLLQLLKRRMHRLVQIAATVKNGQDSDQAFAYLVQVQDGNVVTVSLAWITESLTAGQSMRPALSWTPDASGTYTATVFVWESVDNPTALSPTVSVDIDVV